MSPERSLASYAAAVLSLAFQALDRGVSLRDATCTLCEDGLTVLLEVPVGDDESIGAAFQLPNRVYEANCDARPDLAGFRDD
jgi:hypothetical protein